MNSYTLSIFAIAAMLGFLIAGTFSIPASESRISHLVQATQTPDKCFE
jgi:hypothetical protein